MPGSPASFHLRGYPSAHGARTHVGPPILLESCPLSDPHRKPRREATAPPAPARRRPAGDGDGDRALRPSAPKPAAAVNRSEDGTGGRSATPRPDPLPSLACLRSGSLPPGDSSGGRAGQRPLSATPSRPTCTPPRAPTPAAPPQTSRERRALGAGVRPGPTRGGSPALPRSTSPRPARGRRSSAEGGAGTGEELPSAAAPPRPRPRPRPPPPRSPGPARPLALAPPSRPTPGTSPLSAPPTSLPPNFPPRWRPRSWPAAPPRDRLPGARSQWEVRRRLARRPELSALPLGGKGEEGRAGAGEGAAAPAASRVAPLAHRGGQRRAPRTKALTQRLYRWPGCPGKARRSPARAHRGGPRFGAGCTPGSKGSGCLQTDAASGTPGPRHSPGHALRFNLTKHVLFPTPRRETAPVAPGADLRPRKATRRRSRWHQPCQGAGKAEPGKGENGGAGAGVPSLHCLPRCVDLFF